MCYCLKDKSGKDKDIIKIFSVFYLFGTDPVSFLGSFLYLFKTERHAQCMPPPDALNVFI